MQIQFVFILILNTAIKLSPTMSSLLKTPFPRSSLISFFIVRMSALGFSFRQAVNNICLGSEFKRKKLDEKGDRGGQDKVCNLW